MEFHYPKDYKPARTEADEMRSKAIKEYYEKKEINKKIMNKIYAGLIIGILVIFLILKLIKII